MAERQRPQPALLFAALDRELQARPRGTIRTLERALGRSLGWWQNRRARTGDISTQDLVRALKILGIDLVRFVRETLGAEHGLELDEPLGSAPAVVDKAWKRFRSGDDGEGLGEKFLRSIDEQGYQDPASAVGLVESSIGLANLPELPQLLATAGSGFRVLIQLREAEHCFHAAIHQAFLQADHRTAGNLMRRFSYLLADHGRYQQALHLADRAVALLAREDDIVGVAKGCVEQGQWLYRLGREREAISAFQAALRRLPESESRYRCAAHQSLGVVYQGQGMVQQALSCFEAATPYLESLSSRHRAKLLWLRASIHTELGELSAATSILRDVVSALARAHAGEAALATCELVRLLLRSNQPAQACQVAFSMRSLIEPLAGNAVISAAVADLLRSGQEGLTLALVDRVWSRIERERQDKRGWLRLQIPA